jgi:hypothetical protein
MITEITHTQLGLEMKTEIELDELGVLIMGMNKKYLSYIPEKKRKELVQAQNELVRACTETETPIILYHNSLYGAISSSLHNTLSNHHILEVVKDSNCIESKLNAALQKWEVKYLIFTGTNISCFENIAEDRKTKISEIITSNRLIATPENDKPGFKKQIAWFEKNGIYFPKHDDLLDLIYKKNM